MNTETQKHDMTLEQFVSSIMDNLVRSAAVVQRRAGHWEVWAHCGPTLADASSDRVCPAPNVLDFFSLEGAYGFIRQAGYRGTVEVDDSQEVAERPQVP